MSDLSDLAFKHKTDKGVGHGFIWSYESYLEPIRYQVARILEIGIDQGHSHHMWHEYFPNAEIIGWDIVSKEHLAADYPRFSSYIVDQADRNQMQSWIDEHGGNFDIIIDDGGHTMEQQQISIGFLWKYLNRDGIYICEDLHTSLNNNPYEFAGGQCREDFSNSSLEMFRRIQENKEVRSEYLTADEIEFCQSSVESCEIIDVMGDSRHITAVLRKNRSVPTVGYFHVAMMHGMSGLMVAAELHGRIQQSRLYDETDVINVTLLGPSDLTSVAYDYIFSRYDKYKVRFISKNLELWEWPTLETMKYDCSRSDIDVWYVHTKGVSNCRPDVIPRIQRNIRSWRGVMSSDIINKYRKMDLRECDVIGSLYAENPPVGSHHFVGNFWWSKSSHIARLPTITELLKTNRNSAESWIGEAKHSKLVGSTSVHFYDCYDFNNQFGELGPLKDYQGAI
jgi:hypothetical protein